MRAESNNPAVHAEISLAALVAGKHVYSEKPFVTDIEDGKKILTLAKQKGLHVGNAPDTFLGGRWQTCRKLIDEGVIGAPTGVTAFVGTHGVERHHPNPDFYYLNGGGPLLDLGPYYLTAMVFLLGPIRRVCGMSRRTFDQRMIESQPRHGEMMNVEVDTHVQSMIEFDTGVIGSMTMSFDVWDSEMPRLEIYGEKGTICIPDPDPVHGANIFQGEAGTEPESHPAGHISQGFRGLITGSQPRTSMALTKTRAGWVCWISLMLCGINVRHGRAARWLNTSMKSCRAYWNLLNRGSS